jgi:hypothetical protein
MPISAPKYLKDFPTIYIIGKCSRNLRLSLGINPSHAYSDAAVCDQVDPSMHAGPTQVEWIIQITAATSSLNRESYSANTDVNIYEVQHARST